MGYSRVNSISKKDINLKRPYLDLDFYTPCNFFWRLSESANYRTKVIIYYVRILGYSRFFRLQGIKVL